MSEHESHPKIGITIGDFNGVGPEIIISAFSESAMHQVCTLVIYGSSKVISFYRKAFNNAEFNYNTARNIKEVIHRKVNVINCWEEEVKIDPGKPSGTAGQYALRALEHAANDLQQGFIDALVTCPIDKNTIQGENFKFPGHTEYLAEKFKAVSYAMILASGKLRVATVTGHIPVSKIKEQLSTDAIVSKIIVVNESLKRDFGIRKPRIAVLGLNPHAGDNGLLGKEEQEIIIPAIKILTEKKLLVFGPYSADGFFANGTNKSFDVAIAMYHDQGLIPFKTLAFDTGVNFTAGLPVVRCSPDHGTAYDIAGKGIASATSLRESIYLACDVLKNRLSYDEANANPLAFSKMGGDR
jgi:4-hydroxythreonine-4-phosphate dehydrogenase